MHLHLDLQRSAPRSFPWQQTKVRTGTVGESLYVPKVFPPNVIRPNIQVVRARSDGRASDCSGIIYGDVNGCGPVVIVVRAAGDLRVINFLLRAVDVLNNLKIEIGIILGTPEADFCEEGAVAL